MTQKEEIRKLQAFTAGISRRLAQVELALVEAGKLPWDDETKATIRMEKIKKRINTIATLCGCNSCLREGLAEYRQLCLELISIIERSK